VAYAKFEERKIAAEVKLTLKKKMKNFLTVFIVEFLRAFVKRWACPAILKDYY